jgi:rhodanese-related sulfurtransferase
MGAPWWWPFNALFWRIPSISSGRLQTSLFSVHKDSPLLLLDVRSESEFKSFHIVVDKSIGIPIVNVSVYSLSENIPAIKSLVEALRHKRGSKPANTDVVCICLSAHRSPPAVRMLHAEGIPASQLAYGMAAWKLGGHPVESGQGISLSDAVAFANGSSEQSHPNASTEKAHVDDV